MHRERDRESERGGERGRARETNTHRRMKYAAISMLGQVRPRQGTPGLSGPWEGRSRRAEPRGAISTVFLGLVCCPFLLFLTDSPAFCVFFFCIFLTGFFKGISTIGLASFPFHGFQPLPASSTFAQAYVRVCAHLCVQKLREIRRMTASAVAFITSQCNMALPVKKKKTWKTILWLQINSGSWVYMYVLRLGNTPLPHIAFDNHLLVCPHFDQATLLVAFGLCVRWGVKSSWDKVWFLVHMAATHAMPNLIINKPRHAQVQHTHTRTQMQKNKEQHQQRQEEADNPTLAQLDIHNLWVDSSEGRPGKWVVSRR